tara:strand:+ start:738 stop:845 length:108 start_codon:yes stop_codon:yes gene_type:complete
MEQVRQQELVIPGMARQSLSGLLKAFVLQVNTKLA